MDTCFKWLAFHEMSFVEDESAVTTFTINMFTILVPSEQPLITGPQPAITTALNAGSTYTYVCTARNGRPAPNILWKLGTSLSSSVEFHQGITENTTTNSDSTLSKSSSLSWVPITADNGKSLYCQTGQTQAGGSVLTKSSAVAIVVQRKSQLHHQLALGRWLYYWNKVKRNYVIFCV